MQLIFRTLIQLRRSLLLLILPGICTAAQPNIIIILADDMGWGDVGYNDSVIRTPAIDSLAKQGIRLERYYAQPTCSPTRSALMTGQSSLRNGILRPIDKNMLQGLPLNRKLLPQYFREAGYQTWLVGKWHLGHAYQSQLPMNRGFDHAYGHLLGGVGYWDHVHGGGVDWHCNGKVQIEEGYATHLLTEEALTLLRTRNEDQPFLMYLSYTAPHLPNEAPEETIATYAHIEDEQRRVHAAMVEELDRGVAEVIAALESEGLRENTLIWFMSDNGGLVKGSGSPAVDWLFSVLDKFMDPPYPTTALEFVRGSFEDGGADNGPFRMGKGFVYEGGVRVPSVVNWPGTVAPGSLKHRVTVVDVLPTLLQFVNLEATEVAFDGISHWPELTGQGEVESPDYAITGMDGSEAYYHGDWKLIATSEDDWQLFNLGDDPTESRDLAFENPGKARELYTLLQAYPRGPSIHSTPMLDILLDPDAFGGEIDRPPWVERVREGALPSAL